MASAAQIVALFDAGADPDEALLDRVFFRALGSGPPRDP
jgi:hypothetical protein